MDEIGSNPSPMIEPVLTVQGQAHLSVNSEICDSLETARAQVSRLLTALTAYLRSRNMQISGTLPLPSQVDDAYYRDGMRVLVGYVLHHYDGLDNTGEPIYRDGWRARVDALCVPEVS